MYREKLRKWKAKWISADVCYVSWGAPVLPSPYFRKEFTCNGNEKAVLFLCGLGYHELYLNGEKIGEDVLQPVVSQYDKRARYVVYDISAPLRSGRNCLGIILGDGWYNPSTNSAWDFDKISWADYPKLICELELDGKMVLPSDRSWRYSQEGPIIFSQLRNGEYYDARKELSGWSDVGYDESKWKIPRICPGAGGILNQQKMPGCKVVRNIVPERAWPTIDGGTIYDMGLGMTGWVKIKVRGERGTIVRLRYSERLNAEKNSIERESISEFIKSGEFQTDRYILKGDVQEEWEPRFVYHGFNFVEVVVESGAVQELEVVGRFVHTDFSRIGNFSSDNPMLNKLYAATCNSFVGNFTGIPTDCPHREKNGWTGDAAIACETGLFNYDLTKSYAGWIQSIADVQRANGQLPGIIPSGGWGFNWGSGPVWDVAFFSIPWYVYVFSGDDSLIRENFTAMRRYLDFAGTLAEDNLISFGLGDWCHHDQNRILDTTFSSTAYYYWMTRIAAKCATILGKNSSEFEELACKIHESFNRNFYHGNGVYAQGEATASALALEFRLCPENERGLVAEKLKNHFEARECRADFGIIGAKYVPRALANAGFVNTALDIITQRKFPGWGNWIAKGATTLWEHWDGTASQNHIMFGDIVAWMMQFLAGITPDENAPGFRKLTLKPNPAKGVNRVDCSYRIPAGKIQINWRTKEEKFIFKAEIPPQLRAEVILPNGESYPLNPGKNQFTIQRCCAEK